MRFLLMLSLISRLQSADCWSSQQLHNSRTPSRIFRLPRSTLSTTRLRAQRPSTTEETESEDTFFFPWSKSSSHMESQVELLDKKNGLQTTQDDNPSSSIVVGGLLAAVGVISAVGYTVLRNFDLSTVDVVQTVENIIQDPTAALDQVVQSVDSMGVLGVFYFGVAYTIAEVLAIPAIPLTASAGYLFGPLVGTSVVLFSASIAAAISFAIGRTILRTYVEGVLEEYPNFAKIDRAIGKEGFKLMFLLRLSPLFPFALSNYLYGASSIDFSSFFFGTLFGFAPGTLAYVYSGYVGKALTDGAEGSYPWYVYAGGLTIFVGFLKIAADTATRIVGELEDEEEDEANR
ncbi:unnamed protein product [Cylindrotheca closterium]|uniref:VTT domain-containing protein n=1 Tax=Cylindrotheca closterium TaxID=2856 RepID=A0AAD2JP80_9STRA|nr:unnamed protein product [Cylindrotheca closterium]